jgi:uracil phosphoribosyltransferase
MAESVMGLLPKARIGHIGLYRDEETLEANEYLAKIPSPAAELNIILDPMFATGGSAIKAVEIMISKGINLNSIKYLSLVAAPEGLEKFSKKFPQIPVYTAKIDDHLNEKGYIVPGLGDAGDRIFGTEQILK